MTSYYMIKEKTVTNPSTKRQSKVTRLMVINHGVFKRYEKELKETTQLIEPTDYSIRAKSPQFQSWDESPLCYNIISQV